MYIRLISAPEAFGCPLEAVPPCVPARMIDFSGQALHPHVLALISTMCAAVAWLLPHGAFQGFMAASPLNPKLMCMALQLQLFLGILTPCVTMVFCILSNARSWIWTFSLTVSRAGRLRNYLKLISFPCLFLACHFSFMATRFSRSPGSQQMFAEMDFRSCLYCRYSAFA